ncbi:ATP12 family chaperone protein [Novispirillum sp. DQ9]|uniref:ATP12 family chaperone protein n=1 Tax=Novispirillum sp. DQ9 TaxID=3398612 RepID=UPI003C7DAAD4
MLNQRPRRFWKQATVIDDPAVLGGEGFGIALDGRPVRVPSRRPLLVRRRALAEAIAAEWNGQGETFDPASMPLTQFANTAQDRVGPMRGAIIAELMAHADSEVLCYRAEDPADLAARQAEAWDPLLEWARQRCGCVWTITGGLMPVSQGQAVHAALRAALEAMDDDILTAFQVAAPLCGSPVLGLALVEGQVTAGEAHAASLLDELYQAAKWGEDREAVQRRARAKAELEDVARFVALVRS